MIQHLQLPIIKKSLCSFVTEDEQTNDFDGLPSLHPWGYSKQVYKRLTHPYQNASVKVPGCPFDSQ